MLARAYSPKARDSSLHDRAFALDFLRHRGKLNAATDNLDVQFGKSVVYNVPILASPKRLLWAILAVRTVKDHLHA